MDNNNNDHNYNHNHNLNVNGGVIAIAGMVFVTIMTAIFKNFHLKASHKNTTIELKPPVYSQKNPQKLRLIHKRDEKADVNKKEN